MKQEYPELRLFSITKAAELLHIGRDTLNTIINQGKIHVIKINNDWRISYQEIMNFIQINSVSLILEEVDEVIDDESILSNGKNYNTIEIFNQYFKENNNG